MKRFCFLIVVFLVSTSVIFSQGIVRGKVTDVSGEALIGVIVGLKSNMASGVLTDLDGNFTIKVPEGTSQTLVVSYVSYETIEQLLPALKKNEVLIKNFTMTSKNELQEVEVVAKQVKANEYFMENVKRKSATTIDYISSETMKKTGDPNVVAAVARVSGVSTSGGLITVRGIGDRYVKTTLNGSRIPTLDPLTNNIKLDLFPASLVDNIIITKTASPDLPGDWSGAYLSIETKDYPEKLMVNIESQFGYNHQTTFKEVLTSERSSTDWLGFDSGLRNRTHNPNDKLVNVDLSTSVFQEMVALGLGNYYNSLGVTSSWDQNGPDADTYFKLGLVQLGLLAPAQINNTVAFNNAKTEYNSSYKSKAFSILHPDGTDYTLGFKNNWNTLKRRAPLNFSQSFSVGNQTTLFNKPFGYILGFRYGNSVRFDPNGISQRVAAEEYDYAYLYQDNAIISRETNGWSALLNLAYKINSKNSLSFLFMPNYTGTNDVADFNTLPDGTSDQEGRVAKNQFYEQRKQLIYQLKSEHFIEGPKLKIDFNASYTKGSSIAPDFKTVQYGFLRDNSKDSIYQYSFGPSYGEGVKRFYRYLSDNIFDSRLSAELPIGKPLDEGVRKIKFGGAYQQNDRKQDLYDYRIGYGNGTQIPLLENGDISAALGQENFVMTNQQVNYVYQLDAPDRNFSFGKSVIKSAFALADYSLLSYLRISGGLRIEHASIFTDVVNYHNLNLKRDDSRRANVAGYPNINPANINEVNFLPSANLIFKLKENKLNQMNFRLNYSQSLARPSMRELNDAAIYDNEFRTLIYGNSDLKTAHIKNYDFRFESYFKNGDHVSVSAFYKNFTNHIEMSFGSSGLTWNNVGTSTVRGIELEGKKSLTKHFELKANVTLVKSNSQVIRTNLDIVDGLKVLIPIDTINRAMYGQAPYIINGIFGYVSDSLGLTATISYNVQGPRLVITGLIPGRPDVYEMPRHNIDVKVSKTLGKHFSVTATVRDILNAPVRRAYKLNGKETKDYDKFRYGVNYLLSLVYKL